MSGGKGKMVLIIGITGASSVIYGIRLLEVLSKNKAIETHLVTSEAAEDIIRHETSWEIGHIKRLASFFYANAEIGAKLASGSFKRDGMIISPCSIKTMSALSNSYSENLIARAADVTIKERKKLVILVRETPLHIGHLRSMGKLAALGAIILPPIPAFYHKPQTIQDVIDHTVGKVLDLFDIEHRLFERWYGLKDTG